MNRPDPKDLNEILNRCISKLQNGQGLESVLGDYPGYAAQLRPILEAVLEVWSSRGSDTVPIAAMQRSRRRLLSAAAEARQTRALPWWRRQFGMMRGAMVPVVTLLVCVVMLFTGIASAKALPGQPLYSFKLAAEQINLSLPASPSNRLAKEENYDLRRKDEVEALLSKKLEQEVDLNGFLMRNEDGSWRIDDLKITISAALLSEAEHLAGRYVAVHADVLQSSEVMAQTLEARIYTISGKINKIEDTRVQVGDVWVEITPETVVSGKLALGQEVKVSMVRLVGDGHLAVKIDLPEGTKMADPTKLNPSETPDSKVDMTETEVEIEHTPVPTDSPQPKDTQETEHNSDPTQAPEINDSPKPAPSATEKPKDSEENHSTPAPTDSPRRRSTPTPTSTGGQDGEHSPTHSPTQSSTRQHDD